MKLAEQCATQSIPKQTGKNYSAIHPGKFADLTQYEIHNPSKPDRAGNGKLFLRDHIGLTGMQISLTTLPAKASLPFLHKHKVNEELYVFVGGKGQIQIDGDTIDVSEGTCVRIAPDGARVLRNIGDENLHFVVIQALENSLTQDTFDDGIAVEERPVWPA